MPTKACCTLHCKQKVKLVCIQNFFPKMLAVPLDCMFDDVVGPDHLFFDNIQPEMQKQILQVNK